MIFFSLYGPSRSEGPYNERKRVLRIELKTKNKTKVEVLYKEGSFTEVFAIGLAYQGDNQHAKLIAIMNKEEAQRLITMLSAKLSEF